jgi:homoserine O-acetyltransferase
MPAPIGRPSRRLREKISYNAAMIRLGDTFQSDPPKSLVLPDGFTFHHGDRIAPFSIVYETFGELSAARDNAILVCHALSPGAHAAGRYTADDPKPGWWDGMIGYGKGIDLERYFVVCVNFPGSPWGTTGPATSDPEGRPYGSQYPWITVEDMVESQRLVADHLGIAQFAAIAGSSLGGMQVLMWAALHPQRTRAVISMAAASAVPVASVAWHLIGRKLVQSDPDFRGGDYYESGQGNALRGLQCARMVGHMTYLSDEALERKFGRRRRGGTRQFEVDSYLEYQAQRFAASYDANSYIRVQAAMDEMDLDEQFGSLEKAFASYRGKALLISFDTDWLFPAREIARIHEAMLGAGVDSTHRAITTPNGHDAFLVDYHLITPPVRDFLASLG